MASVQQCLLATILVACLSVPAVVAQDDGFPPPSNCNLNVAEYDADSMECVCMDNTTIYDYYTSSCADESVFYGQQLDQFCGVNTQVDNKGVCSCKTGWTQDKDTKACTVFDETAVCKGQCTSPNEHCVASADRPDGYMCLCDQYYYRSAPDTCDTIDLSKNPATNDCPQVAISEGASGYSCACYSGTVNCYDDTNKNGTKCDLKSTCTITQGSEAEGYFCVQDDNKAEECYTVAGFVYDEKSKTATDLDECLEPAADYPCWDNSYCSNLDNGKGYLCLPDPCYESVPVFEIEECVPYDCALNSGVAGDACVCVPDPCQLQSLDSDREVCVARLNFDYSFETRNLVSVAEYADASVYTATITVQNGQFHASYVAASLDSILGYGVTQAYSDDGMTFDVSVITKTAMLSGMSAGDISDMVSAACHGVSLGSTTCILPKNVAVLSNTISFKAPVADKGEGACAKGLVDCGGDNYECQDVDGGRYQCACKEEGTGKYYDNYREICTYEQSLQDDRDYFQNCTIGVSVTLLIVCLAGMGGGAFYWFKLRK